MPVKGHWRVSLRNSKTGKLLKTKCYRISAKGCEEPLKKGMVPTPVSLPGETHGQRSPAGLVHGVAKSETWPSNEHFSQKHRPIQLWIRIDKNTPAPWPLNSVKDSSPQPSGSKPRYASGPFPTLESKWKLFSSLMNTLKNSFTTHASSPNKCQMIFPVLSWK